MFNQFSNDGITNGTTLAVSYSFKFAFTERDAVDWMAASANLTPKARCSWRWLCFKHRVLIPMAMTGGVCVAGSVATLAALGLI